METQSILEFLLTSCSASRQESFLLFTAYNIASQYLTNGNCKFSLGEFVPVSPTFSVSQPATVNSTQFLSTALSSFKNRIGFSLCSGGGVEVSGGGVEVNNPLPAVTTAPTASISSLLTLVTSALNQNLTQSNPTGTTTPNRTSTQPVPTQSSRSHDNTIKVANAVAIPIAFLGLALLAFLVYKRRKAQKILKGKAEDASSQNKGSPQKDTQPYLQRKAELEAEEKQKHELEARERRYEMGSEGERYELPAGGERDSMRRTRQELRGEEHSTELGVSRI